MALGLLYDAGDYDSAYNSDNNTSTRTTANNKDYDSDGGCHYHNNCYQYDHYYHDYHDNDYD